MQSVPALRYTIRVSSSGWVKYFSSLLKSVGPESPQGVCYRDVRSDVAKENLRRVERSKIVSRSVVAGCVFGPDRKRIAGASVMFAAGPVAIPDIAQLTDSQGAFELAAPAKGTYRLVINAPGFSPVERNVEVTGNATSPIEVKVGKAL
jgi:hypothetical protein